MNKLLSVSQRGGGFACEKYERKCEEEEGRVSQCCRNRACFLFHANEVISLVFSFLFDVDIGCRVLSFNAFVGFECSA